MLILRTPSFQFGDSFGEESSQESRKAHLFHFLFAERLHITCREIWLSECTLLITIGAILFMFGAVGIASSMIRIFFHGHTTALAILIRFHDFAFCNYIIIDIASQSID